jgi:cephalosporin hydroxylase
MKATSLELVAQAFRLGALQNPSELIAFIEFLQDQPLHRPLRHILEIGSGNGGTFFALCKLATGTKISLDIETKAWSNDAQHWDVNPCVCAACQRAVWMGWPAPHESLSTSKVFTLVGDSTNPSSVRLVEAILKGEKLDLLHIDGDHTYRCVKSDYDIYRHLVAPGGFIVIHDIKHREGSGPEDEVWKFWSELVGDKQEFIDDSLGFFNGRPCNFGGIGVLRV